jgi:hypothetical protein
MPPDTRVPSDEDGVPETEATEEPVMAGTVEGTTPTGVPVGGVSLTSREVKVTLLDGLARTEVVDELGNATDQTLEGRYRFRVPDGASLSRLGLWVDDRLVEAEMVDRQSGRAVYETITGARRDPALLERQSNQNSLRVYPIPPRGSRRVLVAYDQILPRRGGRLHYAFPLAPLSRGLRRMTISVSGRHAGQPLTDLRVSPARARVERANGITRIHFERSLAQPFDALLADLVSPEIRLSYRGPDAAQASLSIGDPRHKTAAPVEVAERSLDSADSAYFALRFRLPGQVWRPGGHELVILIDGSQSSASRWSSLRATARWLVGSLDRSQTFAILACDTACSAWPPSGLARAEHGAQRNALAWLDRQKPHGATDLGHAFATAARRFGSAPGRQVLYLGDALATAGELDLPALTDEIGSVSRGAELFIAAPASPALELSSGLRRYTATARLEALGKSFRLGPLLDQVRFEVKPSLGLSLPEVSFLGFGTEQVLTGTLAEAPRGSSDRSPAELVVTGSVGTQSVRIVLPLERSPDNNPLVARLWAGQALAQAEADPRQDRAAIAEFSRDHHVLSNQTALLALESDAMYRQFGFERRQGPSASVPRAEASGRVRAPSSHRTRAPMVRLGATHVSGRVPPEAIQRVVRLNHGRFRACYQEGLLRNPDLAGRVTTRFVIGRNGKVTGAQPDPAGSRLDTEVERCIARAFADLVFPAPDNATVNVEYPLLLGPDTGEQPPLTPAPKLRGWPVPKRLEQVSVGDDNGGSCQRFTGDVADSVDTELVIRAMLSGCFPQARSLARTLREARPEDAKPYQLEAAALTVLQAPLGAAHRLAAWVEQRPEDVAGQVAAARAYDRAGDTTRSCAHWRSAARLVGASAEIEYEAVRCLTRLGDDTRALIERQRASHLSSSLAAQLDAALFAQRPPPALPPAAVDAEAALLVTLSSATRELPDPVYLITPAGEVVLPRGRDSANRLVFEVADADPGRYALVAWPARPGLKVAVGAEMKDSRDGTNVTLGERSLLASIRVGME